MLTIALQLLEVSLLILLHTPLWVTSCLCVYNLPRSMKQGKCSHADTLLYAPRQ